MTEDGLFPRDEDEFMGACSWAPAIQMGYDSGAHHSDDLLDFVGVQRGFCA